jgi:TIR domain
MASSERRGRQDEEEPQLGIFLNYRRSDAAPYARLLGDALRSRFGEGQVFTDIDAIGLGADFSSVIRERVESSDVLLALIGKEWLTATDEQGQRRLDQSEDWVRLEIEAALKRNVPVVPTLVEGATMPSSRDLPDSLKQVATRNGIELRDGGPWDADVERLLRALEQIAREKADRTAATKFVTASAAANFAKIQAQREAREVQSEQGERPWEADPKRPPAAAGNTLAIRTAELTRFGMSPEGARLLSMNLFRVLGPDEKILAACRYADATLPLPEGDALERSRRSVRHAAPWRYEGNLVAAEDRLVVLVGWPKVLRDVTLPWSEIRAVRIELEPFRIWRVRVRERARITLALAESGSALSFVTYDLERGKTLRDVATGRIQAASAV